MVLNRNQLVEFAQTQDPDVLAPPEAPPDETYAQYGRFATLIVQLQRSARDIDDLLDDLPGDVLRDPKIELDELDEQLLLDGLSKLPRGLQQEIDMLQNELVWEDAVKIAGAVFDDDVLDDAERLAGWLYRIVMLA